MKKFLALALLVVSAVAQAQYVDFRVGDNASGVSYTFAPFRTAGNWALVPQVGVNQWVINGIEGIQVYATPSVVYSLTDKWKVDAGIGASVFDRREYGAKFIGSYPQFASHVGVTYYTNDMAFGARFVHASNGGLREPNPGVDSFQLSVSTKLR